MAATATAAARNPWVVDIDSGQRLIKCTREKCTRRRVAYLIHDAHGPLIMVQKLQFAVDFINRRLARMKSDRVTVAGLYEAVGLASENQQGGFHKHRYRIERVDIDGASEAFERARERAGVTQALIVTDTPDAYAVAFV